MKQKIRFARIIVLVGFLTLAAPVLLSPVSAATPSGVGAEFDESFDKTLGTGTGGADCPSGFNCVSGIAIPETGLPDTPIEIILLNFMRWLFGIFGFLAIITFLIAGIQYFMAAGNPEIAKKSEKW